MATDLQFPIELRMKPGKKLLLLAVGLFLFGYGAYLVVEGQTTLGTVLAMRALFSLLFQPLGQIMSLVSGAQIVLASADVDNDAFESESKLGRLPEIGRRISVYYNSGDEALAISDNTKGNPDRLGQRGPKHPMDAPAGVVNVDCSEIVSGLVEHSYYLDEAIGDVAATLRGEREDKIAKREYLPSANAYRLLGKS